MSKFNERLKEVRMNLGLKQVQLSRVLKVDQSKLSQYEKGICEPSNNFLNLLYENYQINLHWLITGSGSMFIYNDDLTITLKKIRADINEIKHTIKLD